MPKQKRMPQLLLALVLMCSLIAQPIPTKALGGDSAFITPSQPEPAYPSQVYAQDIPEAFEMVAENETFQLYFNADTLAFKMLDKRSGYLWHSNLDEKAEGDRLNRTWTAFAQSGISIDYLDSGAISERVSVANSETTISVNHINQGIQALVTFLEPMIAIPLVITLEEQGVRVAIPFEAIKEESADFKLGTLHVFPFFGYTREDSIPGYMFIPDGCGSLIRFSATTKATNMYYARYYGEDLGMLTSLPYDPMVKRPYNISIPVMGMVHGEKQNAYLAIVEQGTAYGELRAHPAGIITNFNFLYNTFVYNESYFQATNRSGAGVTTLQDQTNAYDVVIHYRFLTQDDSDYVGMARSYQQYLEEKGILRSVIEQSPNIGIRLEFLGGEKERILFWHRAIPMTTVEQMADILDNLEVHNPEVVYYGWQPMGASSMVPRTFKLDRHLGSDEQLVSLAEAIHSVGGNFYLYYDPQAALVDESGYSMRSDLAMSITNFNLIGWSRGSMRYYLNLDAIRGRFTSLSQDVSDQLGAGLALDGIGSLLYSDFKRGNQLNREETITRYQSLLDNNDGLTAFYLPNDYLYAYLQAYYDIPITNNGYIYVTDTIPFLQIVFAGYIPFYGTALNFSSDIQTDLLKHADFGVYPSFFLTYDVTAKILDTNSNWIYTSSYTQWSEEVNRVYQWLNALLGPVRGQKIVSRQELQPGVSATTYSNGQQIIVNYNNLTVSVDDISVGGRDAVLREVVP